MTTMGSEFPGAQGEASGAAAKAADGLVQIAQDKAAASTLTADQVRESVTKAAEGWGVQARKGSV